MSEWILQVSDLNEYVRRTLAADPMLRSVRLRGEISNFKRHSSGHWYFTLKDERSRIIDLLRKDPEAFFQERKNVELNISRYSSQINSNKLDADKKEKAKSNLEKYQAILQMFKDVFLELIKGQSHGNADV